MEFPKILIKSLLAVGSLSAVTLGGVGLKGLMEKKIDSQKEGEGRKEIPSKTELTGDQKTLVQGVNVPDDCKYLDEACNVTIDNLKLINFSNKQNGNPLTVTPDNVKVDLTITKLSDKEKAEFNNHPIKFNFKVSNANLDIKNGNSDSNKITLLKNTNYEFKKNSQGKLERAWKKITDIEGKIGLNGCELSAGVNRCMLTTAKINIITKDGVRKKQMDVKQESKSRNISYQEGAEGYNNGFKIYFSEKIELVDSSTNPQETIALESKDNYEIKFIEDDWYLSKVEIVSERSQ